MLCVCGEDIADLGKAAKKLAIGSRVEVVFEKERKGAVNDFHYELIETG
jgi:uncharacterized OB-fold protein